MKNTDIVWIKESLRRIEGHLEKLNGSVAQNSKRLTILETVNLKNIRVIDVLLALGMIGVSVFAYLR